MKTLEQGAEEYENSFGEGAVGTESIDFIAGVNSKVAQIEKIKAQINVLKEISNTGKEDLYGKLKIKVFNLQQQLKKLET